MPVLATAQGIQGVHVLTKVVDGVYVAEPLFGGANATIVINDDSVAIVDPHSDPATAGALVSDVAALTDKPIDPAGDLSPRTSAIAHPGALPHPQRT